MSTLQDIATGWTSGRAQRRVRPPREAVLSQLAQWAARRLPSWRTARTAVLTLGGFGLIDAGVWHGFGATAGLVATGVSLFLLEWLTQEDSRDRR